jgi:hypothetical protein
MLYFGRVGSLWGHRAFFGSSWEKNVITPNNFLEEKLCLGVIIVQKGNNTSQGCVTFMNKLSISKPINSL